MSSTFEELYAVNVNEHTEKKKSGSTELTYLSWAWAFAEVKRKCPDMVYEIVKFNGLPYVYDPLTGYMVYTRVTIDGVTHEMWLPVMDGANKAMKAEPYEYQTKFGKKRCEAATMFDINKTIMRCLVKNFAVFGLGLYIYAGEDLPETPDDIVKTDKDDEAKAIAEDEKKREAIRNEFIGLERSVPLINMIAGKGIDVKFVCDLYKVTEPQFLTERQMANIVEHIGDIQKEYQKKNDSQ